ncbi:MAG: hypothetical protein ACJ76V_02575 [Thermoleophilaceae bacterium]
MRRAALALAVAAALAVAGCGGGSNAPTQSGYEKQFNAAIDKAQKSAGTTQPKSSKLADQAKALEARQTYVKQLADSLDPINPPKAVTKAHTELVAGLRAYASEEQPLIDLAKKGDKKAAFKLAQSGKVPSKATLAKLRDALNIYKNQNYKLKGVTTQGSIGQ